MHGCLAENSMAVSGLSCRTALIGTGGAISLLLCWSEREQSTNLVGPPFVAVRFPPSLDGWSSAESHDY